MRILDDDVGLIEEASGIIAENIEFENIVNPASWQSPGDYYQTMPARTRAVIDHVAEHDRKLKEELRNTVYPEFVRSGDIQIWERANQEYIEQIQQKRLYSGKVMCADATVAPYNSISLVGAQIGVSRVAYQGGTSQFVTNLLQWGMAVPRNVSAKDVVNAMRSRGEDLKEKLSNVFIYTVSLYMERKVLIDSGPGIFKLIQGTAFPYEMLVGSGRHYTMQICLDLLAQLIDDGNYACIVSNDSHRDLLTFGIGLEAGEYLVTHSGTEVLEDFLYGKGARGSAHYTDTKNPKYRDEAGNPLSPKELFDRFQKRHGAKVVRGLLRAHRLSAPYVFYCNRDKLHEAVHTLLADAQHSGPRGFPLLVDIADQYCSGAFRAGEYTDFMNAEFARASSGSLIYQSERTTRSKG
jgi:hypothetical protein